MDLYSEIILDHYKNPKNFGKLDKADNSATEQNTSCGDIINVDLEIKDNIIENIAFSGNGCAISQASTSMLTEKVKGLTLKEAQAITDQEIIDMLKIEISPGRQNCALIGLKTLKKAIDEKK